MEDDIKTKAQLLEELATMRKSMARLTQRVTDLEATAVAHQQTEEKLQLLSAERFFQVVLSISDHIYVTQVTEDGWRQNLYLSPEVETLTGYPRTKMMANWSFWPSQIVHPDDRAAAAVQAAQLALGQNSEVEYRLIRADGEIIWVRDRAGVESAGTSKIVYGAVTDVTKRKRREAALGKLLELSRALVTILDPTPALDKAIELAVDIVPAADRGSLQLLDEAGQTLRTAATSKPDEELKQTLTFRSGEGIAGSALANNQPVNVPDVLTDERFIPGSLPLRFRSLLVAPLVVKGRLLGTISLSSEQVGAFTQADETLVQLIADQVAAALENARLFASHLQTEELRKEHQFLQATIDALAAHIAILDESGRIMAVNASWRHFAEANNYPNPDCGLGLNYLEACRSATGPNAEEAPLVAEGIREVMSGQRRQFYLEYACHAPAQKQWYGVRVTRFQNEGRIWAVIAHEDVTERRVMEEALRESEEKYRTLTNQLPVGVYRATVTGKFVYANPALAAMLGYDSVLELIRASAKDRFDNPHEHEKLLQQWTTGGGISLYEMKLRTKTGTRIWVRDIGRAVFDEHGEVKHIDGIVQDITEQKEAVEALLASEGRFRSLVQNSSDIIIVIDAGGVVHYVSPPVERILGRKSENIIGQSIYRNIHPEDTPSIRAQLTNASQQPGVGSPIEFRTRRANGNWIWMEAVGNNLLGDPNVKGIVINARDVTQRRQAEEQLRLLAAAISSIEEGVLITDTQPAPLGPEIVFVNKGLCQLTGYPEEELLGQTPQLFLGPKTEQALLNQLEGKLVSGQSFSAETVNYRQDGSEYHAAWHISPVVDPAGRVTHYVSIQRDVTQLKLLEAQFLQMQKMEAVGRLAGGVAHDFNNLLTVIKGYSELLLSNLDEQSPLRRDVEQIEQAGEQATSLTRQLLIFSRQEMVQPKVLNLNSIVNNTEQMLQRLIGKDIHLVTVRDPSLELIKADPGRMEQVIMNLMINARDAMPQGGQLRLETANVIVNEPLFLQPMTVQPGRYVQLTISDTGTGMDEETLSHIFEPFYTTKEQNKGTGLGLSTVYAIVTQMNGSIQVNSELGQGTTFKIYLPCLSDLDEGSPQDNAGVEVEAIKGTETILLVEDEEAVRGLARRVLLEQGYHVLEAQHGDEALRLCEQYQQPIHLLLTDVIIPGEVSGRELAERLEHLLPQTKVLFISGYTDDIIVYHGVMNASVAFLQKPFTPTKLLHKVREVLDAPKPS